MRGIHWIPIVLPALVLAFPATGRADVTMAEMPRTINVAGRARVEAVPDTAYLSLAVQRRNATMRAARDATVRVSNDFIALCKKLGIKDSKVRTSGLSIQPEYRWDEKTNQQVFVGYFVQRDLQVELNDLDKLGDLIEGAVDVGVNQVNPPQLDSSRRRDLNRQVLGDAAADAKLNAQKVADSLGVKLGALRTLQAADAQPPPQPVLMNVRAMATMEKAADGAGASYQPGEITFESSVSASFDVLP